MAIMFFIVVSVLRVGLAYQVPRRVIPTNGDANPNIVTVKINSQEVPVKVNGVTIAHKKAYFGDITIGYPTPQKFTVIYDTGSAHLFVPSVHCRQESCTMHRQYDGNLSESVQYLDHDGTRVPAEEGHDRVAITYGTGRVVGDFAEEIVCLGDPPRAGDALASQPHCVMMRVITATELSDNPFREFVFDGVLGLGMETLAVHPDFNVFHMMSKGGTLAAVFGFYMSPVDSVRSEISFGGYDTSRMTESLRWAPVKDSEKGFWQIAVHGMTIGGEKYPLCDGGACQAIVDTGTSLLGVPTELGQKMTVALARQVHDERGLDVNCRQYPGPTIIFDLGGFKIEVGPEDYSQQVPITLANATEGFPANATVCRSTLFPITMPVLGPHVFLFGEPVLRKYYTAYDLASKRVGFAIATKVEELPAARDPEGVPTQPQSNDVAKEDVHVV